MKITLFILLLLAPMLANAVDIKITWTPPTTRADGTPLHAQDIKHHTVYSEATDAETNVVTKRNWNVAAGVNETTVMHPSIHGRHCYTMTTTDIDGLHSAKSSSQCVKVVGSGPADVQITVELVP